MISIPCSIRISIWQIIFYENRGGKEDDKLQRLPTISVGPRFPDATYMKSAENALELLWNLIDR